MRKILGFLGAGVVLLALFLKNGVPQPFVPATITFRPLEVTHWENEKELVETIRRLKRPIHFRHIRGERVSWVAARNWTLDGLVEQFGEEHPLSMVLRTRPGAPEIWLYSGSHPLHDKVDGRGGRIKPTYYGEKMTLGDFAERSRNPEKHGFMYYTQPLDKFVDDGNGFMHPLKIGVPEPGRKTSTQLWMGSPGVTTHTHIDIVHNFYCQVSGRKRFIIFSDQVLTTSLYLFPVIHPNHRRSQAPLDGGPPGEFPAYPAALEKTVVVTLDPGDCLYLPPLHAHHVTNIDGGVSVNVWSEGKEVASAFSKLQKLVDLVPESYHTRPIVERVVAARTLTILVLNHFFTQEGHNRTREEFTANMYSQRFAKLWPNALSPEESDVARCGDGIDLPLPETVSLIRLATEKIVPAMGTLSPEGPSPRIDLFLAEWVEMTAYASFRIEAKEVPSFILNCLIKEI